MSLAERPPAICFIHGSASVLAVVYEFFDEIDRDLLPCIMDKLYQFILVVEALRVNPFL